MFVIRISRKWLVSMGAIALFIVIPFLAFGRSLWQGFAPIDDAYLIA